MVRQRPSIVWDADAKQAFKQVVAFIKNDSIQNADKVRRDINAAVRKLADEPEQVYAPDKYKKFNDGSYRAFEIHHCRIAYFTGADEIRIVRFRHTSQQPENY